MDVFLSQVYCIANDPVSLFWLLFFSSLGNNIFPPIPIEFGTVFAGYLASKGHGTLPVIIAGTASGMILGSLLLYAAARVYGPPLLNSASFQKVLRREQYDRAAQWFHKYGVWTFFVAKFAPGMNLCAVLCAGILKLDAGRAGAGIIASNLLVFAGLAFLGKSVGENWQAAYRIVGGIGFLFFAVILGTVLTVAFLKRPKNNQKTEL